MKTTLVKENEIERKWILIDAEGQTLGRLATRLAALLRGKNKVTYAPHIDQGDFIVVVNAAKVRLTGNKEDQKIYKHYTGFSSGLREFSARQTRSKNPTRMITQAVSGMLPKNKLSRQMLKRLRVFPGATHTHAAQKPEPVTA
jgi:large subunit ribosomal protein L13